MTDAATSAALAEAALLRRPRTADVPDLTWFAWALLGVAALIVGLSKTAVPGAGTVAVAIFAAVLPAKQSTGTLLLLLIVADLFAVLAYRRHTNWRALLRLAPAVIVGHRCSASCSSRSPTTRG